MGIHVFLCYDCNVSIAHSARLRLPNDVLLVRCHTCQHSQFAVSYTCASVVVRVSETNTLSLSSRFLLAYNLGMRIHAAWTWIPDCQEGWWWLLRSDAVSRTSTSSAWNFQLRIHFCSGKLSGEYSNAKWTFRHLLCIRSNSLAPSSTICRWSPVPLFGACLSVQRMLSATQVNDPTFLALPIASIFVICSSADCVSTNGNVIRDQGIFY